MKDFVRDVWKIAAVCATGAFLLSLVIGLFAGNPFGIAFFRALLFAVIFAGLGTGLRVVVKGYLPELVASNPQTAANTGAKVDIVLPEDDGLRRQAYSGTSPRAPQAGPGDGEADGEPEEVRDADSMDEDSASQAEEQALGKLAEELAEELPGAPEAAEPNPRATAEPNPRATAERRSMGSETSVEPVEEAEPEDELPRSARESTGDLDSLPDIAALEPPSERPGPGSARSMRLPTSGERPEDAVRNVLSGQDPATLARALRTVLKKDEKG